MSDLELERLARVALNRMGEPGNPRMAAMVAAHGAKALYDMLRSERDIENLLTDGAARLAGIEPERELAQAERLGIRFLVPGDQEWPTAVDDLEGVEALHDRGGIPLGLWVKGPLRLDTLAESLAIVGSRSSTTYGDRVAQDLAACVGRTGRAVISGAAFGIDIAAHRGALAEKAPTIAVLACGVDRIYPKAHAGLLAKLSQDGAVVSEAPPGCAPQRIRFLARNRIIAALSQGTVVVEAAVRSGALNTANWAGRLNRLTMGIPGPVTSAPSAGVHARIRDGSMTLVTSGQDVLELIGASGEHLLEDQRAPESPRDLLPTSQKQVLDAVPAYARADVDSICLVAGLGRAEVGEALRKLEGVGLVTQHHGGWCLAEAARTWAPR